MALQGSKTVVPILAETSGLSAISGRTEGMKLEEIVEIFEILNIKYLYHQIYHNPYNMQLINAISKFYFVLRKFKNENVFFLTCIFLTSPPGHGLSWLATAPTGVLCCMTG